MTALTVSNIVLWVAVLALSLVVLALVRQLGVLHERIAPAGALMLNRGLVVGERVPMVDATDLEGHELRIGIPRSDGKSTLLVFVSATCPVCKTLLPVLKTGRKQEQHWLQILLASDGDREQHRRFAEEQGLTGLSYLISTPLGLAYQVSRLPFAVLFDADGILRARGLINSREHLESLFEAQRLGIASLQEYFASRA